MAYVYVHYRLDNHTIFYIGVSGADNNYYSRSTSKKSRNKEWYEIVNQCGYRAEIIIKNVDISSAYQAERDYITFFGRTDLGTGILCNKSDGGDGVQRGLIPWNKGLKMPEHIILKCKRTNYPKGKDHPNYGKKWSAEIRLSMSIGHKGMTPWNKGIKRTDTIGANHGRSKKVIDTSTNVIYDTMKDAATYLGVSNSYLNMMLNNKKVNKTSFVFFEMDKFTKKAPVETPTLEAQVE